jgi:hypothetical protein
MCQRRRLRLWSKWSHYNSDRVSGVDAHLLPHSGLNLCHSLAAFVAHSCPPQDNIELAQGPDMAHACVVDGRLGEPVPGCNGCQRNFDADARKNFLLLSICVSQFANGTVVYFTTMQFPSVE